MGHCAWPLKKKVLNSSPNACKAHGLSTEPSSTSGPSNTVLTAGITKCQQLWAGSQNPFCRENTAWRWEVITVQGTKGIEVLLRPDSECGPGLAVNPLPYSIGATSLRQEKHKSCLQGGLVRVPRGDYAVPFCSRTPLSGSSARLEQDPRHLELQLLLYHKIIMGKVS